MASKRILKIAFFLAISLQWATAYAFEVKLQWDPNQEPTLAGYMIHYGNHSRNYLWSENVALNVCTQDECEFTLDLPAGRWYFALTAYDLDNNESGFSKEVFSVLGFKGTMPWLTLLLGD